MALFYKIGQKSPMMSDAGSRSLLGLLMINKRLGIQGMNVRWQLFKKQRIFLTKADLDFTAALFVYDQITRIAMREIANKMLVSRDMDDFHTKLSPLGRCYVYAQVKAAIAYYDATLSSLLMIPGVKLQVFSEGIYELRDLRYGIEEIFRPNRSAFTRLRYEMPDMWRFKQKYDMAWYLCNTDLAWSQVFIKALKSSSGGVLKPLNYVIQVIEPFLQGYFNNYVSGIEGLAHEDPLYDEEYAVLRMSFETDLKAYLDFAWYYSRCGILPNEFFEQMRIFIKNVYLMVKEVYINYG